MCLNEHISKENAMIEVYSATAAPPHQPPRNRRMPRNQHLEVEIEDDELRIRIGIDTLRYATESCPALIRYNEETGKWDHPRVADVDVWAQEVLGALIRDNPYGDEAPPQQMLDKAMEAAVENGAEGILMPDDDDYEHYDPWSKQ